MTKEYQNCQLQDNTTYLDREGNYYCRILNMVRNTQVGTGICASGCPCYIPEQGKDKAGAQICRYYQTKDITPSKDVFEYKEQMDRMEKENKIPVFPQVEHLSERMQQAYAFAAHAHRNQKRKGIGIPYFTHLVSALEIANGLTREEDILIAVLLHDTLEDTDTTKEQLEAYFGSRVAELVADESEDKRRERSAAETWKERKIENIARIQGGTIEAKIIALSDKLSNLRSIAEDLAVMGEKTWEKFNQKDSKEHAWYYSQFISVFQELKDTNAYNEYVKLIQQVFDIGRE